MPKKEGLAVLFIILSVILCLSNGAKAAEDNPEIFKEMSQSDIQALSPADVADNIKAIQAAGKAQYLTSGQLAAVSESALGNLGQYDADALSDALKQKGYDIESLTGNLAGATISGNTLTLADGSTFDLRSGKKISIQADGGGVQAFSDNAGVYLLNAQGVTYEQDRLRAATAGEAGINGAKAQQVKSLDANPSLFSVASADVVLIGPLIFSDIAQSTFSVRDGELQSASVTSAKDRNTITFPNPIACINSKE